MLNWYVVALFYPARCERVHLFGHVQMLISSRLVIHGLNAAAVWSTVLDINVLAMKRIVFFLASFFLTECSRRPIRDVLDDEYGELLWIGIRWEHYGYLIWKIVLFWWHRALKKNPLLYFKSQISMFLFLSLITLLKQFIEKLKIARSFPHKRLLCNQNTFHQNTTLLVIFVQFMVL